MHLVGFIIRIYHDARSLERRNITAIFNIILIYFNLISWL